MSRHGLHISFPLVASLTLLSGCGQSSPAAEVGPRPVKSVVTKAEQSASLSFPGVVQARVVADLGFRTLGRVLSRKADVGDLVRKGDVLAEIDPLALQFAVASAEADLRNAEAQLQNAELTEKRKRALASRNTGSAADLELAEQGLISAQAGVAKARASLDKAREQLGYAQLKAEFDGVVTATSVEVGQTVTTGQPVLTLAQLGQRDVVVDIPEAQLGSLRLGSRFNVALQLKDALRTSGILREIGPEADTNTRTHRLKIAIDDAPEVFRLGSVVTVAAMSDQPGSTIVLPTSAIVENNGTVNVWVIDPTKHTVSLRPVRLDAQVSGVPRVRIASGLLEGEEVAVAGASELSEGQKVRLEKEPRS
ncbi:RND family efflux transporter, MFP subunit [Mesorhizobium albiziae]|uniref:RND family efflux transporter, MFP subunit n=1 Tax=Neomesorhizobium albiziae TaxID=335020 RepID=A0A1I4EWW9_9HYPH|nr:efflux RND transporter periplasmic adaptor subunit [Mesorhizobium albiziae]GLS33466.1 hemolysin secretion protein D [Mesorhizobium albiziae]SFL09703.1 RND family efflux transporter, MFP subunit [Mesorhizobium albiziae]